MSDTSTTRHTPRVFSGVQPTGNLTLGNYLGAVRNFVALQDDDNFERLYCVVDMHAITQPFKPAELKSAIHEVAAAFIASGLDPAKSILFNQSRVSAHAELGWIFNCVARMGWLNRMTQFKEKAGKNKENASVGLYAYPNLMAADILVYRATHVPVGDDQKQHLELTRDIAQKFNNDFEAPDFFPLCEPLIPAESARIMSLRDGTAKMSKSDPSNNSRINLSDTADLIAQKIRKAKTDPEPLPSEIEGLAERPEARNLVGIFAALAGTTQDAVLGEYGGRGFGDFKPALADLTVEKISPIGDEMRRLTATPDHIDAILSEGADRAAALARPIMTEVYEILGLQGGGSAR